MRTTVFATEYHNHAGTPVTLAGTPVTLADDDAVILVRNGAMSARASHPRYLLDARDIIAETTLRAVLDGNVEGDEGELNVAVSCTVEERDGETILVPFRVNH